MEADFFIYLEQILEICYKSGVRVVSVYAFSIENFKRSKYEVDALMDIAKIKLGQLSQHGDLMDRYGACIKVLGQTSMLNPDVIAAVNKAVEMTKHNNKYGQLHNEVFLCNKSMSSNIRTELS